MPPILDESKYIATIWLGIFCLLSAACACAQNNVNYNEAEVPEYILPDVLTCEDGTKVTSAGQWEAKRRGEVLEWFTSHEYGRTPTQKIAVEYETLTENKQALGGKATCKQVKFTFSNGGKTIDAILLLWIPNHVKGKIPVFVGYNFKGNHSTTLDPEIVYSDGFRAAREPGHPDWERGVQMGRWCYDLIIDRGYAVATMCYHDIFPDRAGTKDKSIVSLFSDYDPASTAPDEWQAIGAWAWGSSRIVDYLETEQRLDASRIALMGHSRQGKAALWAGVLDTRFGIVISNDSGAGGAALSMREYGERLGQVAAIKPAWFCPAYSEWAGREKELPYDQHELLALVAPRHLYVASAVQDSWADPRGEYLSLYHAGPVFALYGMEVMPTETMPAVDRPVMLDVGYHIRSGGHDVTEYDWKCFLDFADKHFGHTKR